ncbi:MAG TPA: carboxypeptidase regulatory-like domain-containing protein [Vicinamibacteria bacterium]|nr:carboxypeptidase regulatory-like domain-containing protein [Vicinamibacteria bacterium]
MIDRKAWYASLAVVLFATTAGAQTRIDGAIEGQVVDAQGLAVPGATVTVASPALIQAAVVTTGPEGRYRATRLPTGTYTVRVSVDGFKTKELTGVELALGKVLVIDATMEPGGMAEAVTVEATTPVIDTQQVKNVQTITKEVIDQLPLGRDPILGPTQLAPGVVERTSAGSRRNETNFLIDGANQNAPNQGFSEANISWDVIEEIEFVTTSNPMENYGAIGGTLNLVTRSGGNQLSGMASYYFSNRDLSQIMLPKESSDAINVAQPGLKESERDVSFRLGGPIKKDKLWFLANYRRTHEEIAGSFVPVTINGQSFENYNAPRNIYWLFGKLTAQLRPDLRWAVTYNHNNDRSPYDRSVPPRIAQEAKRDFLATQHTVASQLTWSLGAKTLIDARFGLWRFNGNNLAQAGTEMNPHFIDRFTGYEWGRRGEDQRLGDKRNYSGSVSVNSFLDDWGGSHELKAGVEYQPTFGQALEWSPGNSIRNWDVWNSNPYFYRGRDGLGAAGPLGDGRMLFGTNGTFQGCCGLAEDMDRLGFFVSDVWRVSDRLTLNLGARWDTTRSGVPDVEKTEADPLAVAIGEAIFRPRWGVNPFGPLSSPGDDDRLPWKGFSGQAGLAFDLTGDGLTILKAHGARYQERLQTWIFNFGIPSGGAAFLMNWWDDNGNMQPDRPGIDRWAQADNASPLGLTGTTWRENIDPGIKTPYMNELRAGVERQLGDFNVGVAGLYRDRKNQITDLLYDLDTGQYWSGVDSGYWIPFRTTVPAVGATFPAVPVTMYFQARNAPARFTRLTNAPEATTRYTALDLTVNRRWKGDWMLGGSVVFSKNYGTYEASGSPGRGQFQDPNFLINREGARQPFDRPFVLKLWGSFLLPAQVRASFNFIQTSGSPWNRTVTVQPPAAWAAGVGASTASQTVWLEPSGERRTQSINNLDLRLEKLFRLRNNHEIGVFADAFNVTGFAYLTYQSNPGGTWSPTSENTTDGRFSPASTGPRAQVGVRTVRLSVRYRFN